MDQTCSDFWEKTLKSPRHIVAPMVDMSELSFRMLCRSYECHLCYSPMIHASRYLRDTTYRKIVFSTCEKDRPLIIQLCANDAETFVKAGLLLQSECDGIDLNLGCPQLIAKRGHYGAFLQDDWCLISDIVSTAASALDVPVTCKIRILPSVEDTVKYAQMIEKAGAKMLTVHGRTRDQRQQLTGLADWDAIRAVKEALSIPVIANGNILVFEDVQRCLEYTGADGVMSAEAILHNPALFAGLNPPVCDIAREFLDLCKQYKTDVGHIRTHLFWLFSYSISLIPQLQQELAMANTMDKLEDVTAKLDAHLAAVIDPSAACGDEDKYVLNPRQCHARPRVKLKSDGCSIKYNLPGRINDSSYDVNGAMDHDIFVVDELPSEGAVASSSDENDDNEGKDNLHVTKSQKKLLRAEQKIAGKKLRRKRLLTEKRLRDRTNRLAQGETCCEHVSKYDKKQIIKDRQEQALKEGLKICIDLSLENTMSEKECSRVAQQLCRLYGYNRKSEKPVALYFTGFNKDGFLYKECLRKNTGFENYIISMHQECHTELFSTREIVYLSPDSEHILTELYPDKVYIIGGLADETVEKGRTQWLANVNEVETAKLPLDIYMTRSNTGSYSTILAANQVFDILLTYNLTKSWPKALEAGVPARKGYILKEEYR